MARKKPDVEGRRINVWIPPSHLVRHSEIENFSAFIQICLEQAPDIMAFALLHKIDPKKYYHNRYNVDNVVEKFNDEYPLDPLTAARQGKQKRWPTNSQKLPDVLY